MPWRLIAIQNRQLIAERLSARQLILHRISPSVCICVCVSCHASGMQLSHLHARAVYLSRACPCEQIAVSISSDLTDARLPTLKCTRGASDIQHERPPRHFIRSSTGAMLMDVPCLVHNTGRCLSHPVCRFSKLSHSLSTIHTRVEYTSCMYTCTLWTATCIASYVAAEPTSLCTCTEASKRYAYL